MTSILGAVHGFCLAPQHCARDEWRQIGSPDALDDSSEKAWADYFALGDANIERCQDFAHLVDLFERRGVVDPI